MVPLRKVRPTTGADKALVGCALGQVAITVLFVGCPPPYATIEAGVPRDMSWKVKHRAAP